MGLKIRLARGGSKKRPYYRIVVSDERSPRDGKYIEKIGNYDPMLPKDNDKRVVLKLERIKYWLTEGAKPTDRVSRFLATAGLLPARAIPAQNKKNLQSERTKTKILEREEKRKQAKIALDEAAEQTKAQEAKPAEAKPAEEKSEDKKLAEAKPTEEKPTEEKPTEEKSEDKKPAEEKPAGEKSEVKKNEESEGKK